MNDLAVKEDNILPFAKPRKGLGDGIASEDWLSGLRPGTVFVSLNTYSKGTGDEYTVVKQYPRLTRLDTGSSLEYVIPEVFCRWNELILITGVNEEYV